MSARGVQGSLGVQAQYVSGFSNKTETTWIGRTDGLGCPFQTVFTAFQRLVPKLLTLVRQENQEKQIKDMTPRTLQACISKLLLANCLLSKTGIAKPLAFSFKQSTVWVLILMSNLKYLKIPKFSIALFCKSTIVLFNLL